MYMKGSLPFRMSISSILVFVYLLIDFSCQQQNLCSFLSLSTIRLAEATNVPSIGMDDLEWIISSSRQGHASSCLAKNLLPAYSTSLDFPWNSTVLEYVVRSQLGLDLLNTSYLGLQGCCAAGLWCNSRYCFTQSFGTAFLNYGPLLHFGNSSYQDYNPVYTCIKNSNDALSQIEITSITSDESSAQVKGNGHGFNSAQDVTIAVAAESCSNVEMCSCKQCSATLPCDIGFGCYSVSGSKTGYCFPRCAGLNDGSCPCNQKCRNDYDIFGIPSSLCISSHLNEFIAGCSSGSPDNFICRANSTLFSSQYRTLANYTVDLSSSVNDGDYNSQLNNDQMQCVTAVDCYDGNVCTKSSCIKGVCQSTLLDPNCLSISQDITEDITPYGYFSFASEDNQVQQSQFLSDIHTYGKSAGEFVNIHSLQVTYEQITLPFSLLYFGNLINQFFITPFGAVLAPPTGFCNSNEVGFLLILLLSPN